MKPFRSSLLLAVLVIGVIFPAQAGLKLAGIFGDNMVLQQLQHVPVWGWAAPGATVTLHFNGQDKKTTADANGRWLVTLAKMRATNTPLTLVVTSGETKTLTNILIGEVWLASGQSNMEKPIGKQPNQKPTFNAEAELAAANFPNLRLFKVDRAMAAAPLTDLGANSGWQSCSSNTLEAIRFSAAAYFFGRELHTNLDVPVGLIESAWGGTRIEPWTPPAGFKSVAALAPLADSATNISRLRPTMPMVLYNAMIAPLVGFGLRGAIWYQGESNLMGTNDDDYLTYADKQVALVEGWRQMWGQDNFAFYLVQIAPFKYFGGKQKRALSPERLPEFWTLQAQAVRNLRNSGLVVTTDLTDDLNDIHPRNKAEVGHRLALLARNRTYGERDLVCAGPSFRRLKVSGSKLVLSFNQAEGLTTRDGKPPTWFAVAALDGHFVPAEAKIVQDTVEVSAPGVTEPVAVRFAWDETAQPNLCNQAGLPAEPFRAGPKDFFAPH